jgi:radical SAM superfamily enzyme YgiQ (UPF0313 family)
VALVNPPSMSTPTMRAQDAVQPLGLAYVAAAVIQAGHALTVVDAVGEALDTLRVWSFERRILLRGISFDEIVARIPEDIDVIGVSCMFSNAWRPTRELLIHLKRARPRARLVLGGEHATACHAHILATCDAVDFCVLGEGEATFCELLDCLAVGVDPSGLHGVASRASPRDLLPLAGVRPSERRPRIRAIASIPEPAWERFPLQRYFDAGFGHGVQRGRTMPILASRGCPYQCTFCSSPSMWTTKWTARAPADVLAEMKRYMVRYGATDFAFYDLTAIVARAWIVEFCDLIIDEGLDITWQLPTGTRSEAIDAEVVRLLYRSGCRNIDYAPESGAPSVLRRIKKRVNLDRMMESIGAAVDGGLEVKVNIILGFPDETPAEIAETYAFIARLARRGIEAVGVFAFCPYPGTELFDDLLARGAIRLDDAYFDALVVTDFGRLVSSNERFSALELQALALGAHALFHAVQLGAHPSRVLRTVLQIARREQTSKAAKAIEAMRTRTRAWRELSRGVPRGADG